MAFMIMIIGVLRQVGPESTNARYRRLENIEVAARVPEGWQDVESQSKHPARRSWEYVSTFKPYRGGSYVS